MVKFTHYVCFIDKKPRKLSKIKWNSEFLSHNIRENSIYTQYNRYTKFILSFING